LLLLLQVMFVRVSSGLLSQRVPMAVKALKYSQWAADVAAAAAGLQHNLTARVSGVCVGVCTSL
jgi:hypothetical protein